MTTDTPRESPDGAAAPQNKDRPGPIHPDHVAASLGIGGLLVLLLGVFTGQIFLMATGLCAVSSCFGIVLGVDLLKKWQARQ